LITRTPDLPTRGGLHRQVAVHAVHGAHPAVQVGERHHVQRLTPITGRGGREGPGRGRSHRDLPARGVEDQRAEQAAAHLLVRHLVRVVPERAGLVGDV
jgi:hypothetical protein